MFLLIPPCLHHFLFLLFRLPVSPLSSLMSNCKPPSRAACEGETGRTAAEGAMINRWGEKVWRGERNDRKDRGEEKGTEGGRWMEKRRNGNWKQNVEGVALLFEEPWAVRSIIKTLLHTHTRARKNIQTHTYYCLSSCTLNGCARSVKDMFEVLFLDISVKWAERRRVWTCRCICLPILSIKLVIYTSAHLLFFKYRSSYHITQALTAHFFFNV